MILGIFGAGGLGREVFDLATLINEKSNKWEKILFVDDKLFDTKINNVPVISYNEAISSYGKHLEITVGVGEPSVREIVFERLRRDQIPVVTLIHPNVGIPKTTSIGEGVTIQTGCFISCNTVIEDDVFIQPNVNVGHDNILKKGCIISGLVNLAGHVTVGQNTYIGISTAVKQGVSIGDYCIIGMCSAVYSNIPNEMIAMGNPARPMKKNEEHIVFK